MTFLCGCIPARSSGFFAVFVLLGFALGRGDFLFAFQFAWLSFAWMPMFLGMLFGMLAIDSLQTPFVIAAWLFELGTMLWLWLRKDAISKRSILIVGTALLLLLLTQFIGCTIIGVSFMLNPPSFS